MGIIWNFIRKNKIALIFLLILLVGIFLRTYRFERFITFVADQRRDLRVVENVVENHASWPLLGPDMTDGQGFHLGPIYYYFQIISAYIFGVGPTQQAYPDVFFSILSIPLLYYFLRSYFSQKAALLSMGLYAISYLDIEYSRFAWNVNLIPFFVLLFLVSFWRLLSEDGSSGWKWTALAGLSLGVGVQLHAIILLLLPLVIIISAILLFLIEKKNIWKKLLAVLAIALVLNAGQIISEERTGFANSKDFVRGFVSKGDLPESSWQKRLALDVACNAQANTHIISSLGNKKMCDFLYEDNLPDSSYATPINLDQTPLVLVGETISLLFSILGISFLVFYLRGETDKKRKYFLGLILLYGALYFLIMFPIAPGSRMRYFLPIIFMPFIFLSFIFDYLTKRYPKNYIWIISAIVIFLMAANGISLAAYFRLERHW